MGHIRVTPQRASSVASCSDFGLCAANPTVETFPRAVSAARNASFKLLAPFTWINRFKHENWKRGSAS